MEAPERGEILRGAIFHTPGNPFSSGSGFKSYRDGGLLIRAGRVAMCDDYAAVRWTHPDATTTDLRGGFLLPGFVDTHVHYPQLPVLGRLGLQLLDWLEQFALPEESRMADGTYAASAAHEFLRALVSHGTTTALVFGAHFASATAALFEGAESTGLRIVSGMVLSDRLLRPELEQRPETAYRDCRALIERFHGKGRLLYAVTPRFALSASEEMLEVCQTLLRENSGTRFQTHLNESCAEIAAVEKLFPWATDYLEVYERYDLGGPGAVMAHNLHVTDSQLERLAGRGTSVAHCPCSNAALGSGLFPLRRHLKAGVRCSLGTDVGGGTGFGMLKEGLQAYLLQRLAPDGVLLDAGHLLYLATRAGAEALGLGDETGDFTPGKSADLVYLRAPENSPLAAVVERYDSMDHVLAALFTMGGADCIKEVRVGGTRVYCA
jgi:guanine deaminase